MKSITLLKSIAQLGLVGLLGIAPIAAHASPVDAVIPLPYEVEAGIGSFTLTDEAIIVGPARVAQQLSDLVYEYHNIDLPINCCNPEDASITLAIEPTHQSQYGNEGYVLSVTTEGIMIEAATETGLFYGAVTLVQMINAGENDTLSIPAAEIADKPRFYWRGLMLDEGRHFQGKEFVMDLLDNMAMRKMNKFHWHLTEDEGWRVEVKGYPELTEIGAWRGEGTIMPATKWRGKAGLGKGPHYGGYYTQEELKEIVAYAAARHIEIIPEFDMPGHTNALVMSLPQLAVNPDPKLLAKVREEKKDQLRGWELTGDSPTAYRNNIMNVVNEATYEFCADLFDQMVEIFPSKYWHVGGDEVRPLFWEASPEHLAVMEEEGFTDAHQLQNMFLLRLEDMLRERGRTMVGWNEIMKGGHMSKDTIVMAWIGVGAGIKAAKAGYPTVMAPGGYTYFDMGYPAPDERKANSWAGLIDSKRAYEWNPLFIDKLTSDEQKKILGVHACVWTEYVPNPEDASYKFWPRALSTAEVGWTQQEQRSWDTFQPRFEKHLSFFDTNKTFYRVAPAQAYLAKGAIAIVPGHAGGEIRYTTDGSDPANGKVYAGEEIDDKHADSIRTIVLRPNDLKSVVLKGTKRPQHAKWKINSKSNKPQVLNFTLGSDVIDQAGKWTLHFTPDAKQKNPATVEKIVIKQGNKVVAKATDNIAINRNEASFEVKLPEAEPVSIEVTLKAVQKPGGRTEGTIALDRN